MSTSELRAAGRWQAILGDGSSPPEDPFMLESTVMRTTLPISQSNPYTGTPLTTDGNWNPINGRERDPSLTGYNDLQYSCIFDLAGAADIRCVESEPESPICKDGMQRYAKAYPGTRLLAVAKGFSEKAPFEDHAVLGSICAKHLLDERQTENSFGYRGTLTSLVQELAPSLRATASH